MSAQRRHSARNVPSLEHAAEQLGLSVGQLRQATKDWGLEPTFSVAQVAEFFGCGQWAVHQLVKYGRKYGKSLHPTRGGLWPTYRPLRKCRRIPQAAIDRHLAFMEEHARA